MRNALGRGGKGRFWRITHFSEIPICIFAYKKRAVAGREGAIVAHNAGISPFVGIAACWPAIFAPGIILIYGVLPWWAKFRHFNIYRRCLDVPSPSECQYVRHSRPLFPVLDYTRAFCLHVRGCVCVWMKRGASWIDICW